MSVRTSSRAAFQEINDNGTASTQRARILAVLVKRTQIDGLTRREIQKLTGIDINAVAGRVNGLMKSGLVAEGDVRPCRITGKNVRPVFITNTTRSEYGQAERTADAV